MFYMYTNKIIKKNYFIISAGIISCLISISLVAIANNISIDNISTSPMLKSTLGGGLLNSF